MIQTLLDTNTNIPYDYDGATYSAIPDHVVAGCGDDFAINYSASSLSISFNAGSKGVVGGAFFVVKEQESLVLPSNSTIYVCCEIDNSRSSGDTGRFVALTQAEIKHDILYGSGTIHDMPLYIVTTGANGVLSVVDIRIRATEQHIQVYKTQAEYDVLPTQLKENELIDFNIFEG